ncbi:alpha/beta hydrolase [Pseudoroseicyclus sp. CXY001]|uniref:alpha/beta hydrolase n=1 Tax=Pseudoroseicyclus sp. CXY001 TaxID=3242492 RepID=UPI00357155C3
MDHLDTPRGRRLAYHLTPGDSSLDAPAIVFLGGFRSDMEGTKALFLEDWAREQGRAFLRFDYSGHGSSSGTFEEGAIGDWAEDAAAAIALLDGPLVLVGSSMGGWISLLLSRSQPERVAGLVTIAAAPDFTEEMWESFTEAQRTELTEAGLTHRPSDYGDPYPISRRLIEEGRQHLVMTDPLTLTMPVRMLQGTADADVPQARALQLLAHAEGPDIRLTLVKGADHRFSTPECLRLIVRAVAEAS